MSESRRSARGRWYHPRALARGLVARPKVIVAFTVGGVAALLLPSYMPVSVRFTGSWIAGAIVYLVRAFAIMTRHGTGRIRQTAEAEDESRFVLSAIVLLAVASSFVAVFALSSDAREVHGIDRIAYVGLAVGTIVTAWLVMQVIFTLHYAHDYYRSAPGDTEPARGLQFPGDDMPDYWDFFYFTTSIGATAQTADVAIASKTARRIATVQSVLSFIFNTAILALAVNLASSL